MAAGGDSHSPHKLPRGARRLRVRLLLTLQFLSEKGFGEKGRARMEEGEGGRGFREAAKDEVGILPPLLSPTTGNL